MAESEKRAQMRDQIEKTKMALGALMDRRIATTGKNREKYLQYEYGLDSRGPFIALYLYLAAKLVTLYLAKAFTRPIRKTRHD